MSEINQEQKHPQYQKDRKVVDELLMVRENPSDLNLGEFARLKIRYRGFPGARDIQKDLEIVLGRWGLTEEMLYEKTRALHASGQVYKPKKLEEEDWI